MEIKTSPLRLSQPRRKRDWLAVARFVALGLGLFGLIGFLLLSHKRGIAWAVLAPAVPYIAMAWALWRKPTEGWQQRLAGWTAEKLLGSVPRALATTIALLGVVVAEAFQLREDFFAPNYVFQVYRVNLQQPVVGALITVKNLRLLAGEEQPQTTNADGVARFRIEKGQVYRYRLVLNGADGGQRSTVQSLTIKEAANEAIDIAAIAPSQWTKTGENVEVPGFGVLKSEATSSLVAPSGATTGPVAAHLLKPELWPWGRPAALIHLTRNEYLAGFDPERKIPRWVAFRVNPGPPRPRDNRFVPDSELPLEAQASEKTYVGQGYDRGHLISRSEMLGYEPAPALDLYSIIVPQSPPLNRRLWAKLEQHCVQLAQTEPVWVAAGPAFLPTDGANKVEYLTLPGGVAVPTHLFRVVVRRNSDGRLDAQGFLLPNRALPPDAELKSFVVPVAEIEHATGLRFFLGLSPGERDQLTTAVGELWK